jgi:hypothetical protein
MTMETLSVLESICDKVAAAHSPSYRWGIEDATPRLSRMADGLLCRNGVHCSDELIELYMSSALVKYFDAKESKQ